MSLRPSFSDAGTFSERVRKPWKQLTDVHENSGFTDRQKENNSRTRVCGNRCKSKLMFSLNSRRFHSHLSFLRRWISKLCKSMKIGCKEVNFSTLFGLESKLVCLEWSGGRKNFLIGTKFKNSVCQWVLTSINYESMKFFFWVPA